jgi:hypothetical protein
MQNTQRTHHMLQQRTNLWVTSLIVFRIFATITCVAQDSCPDIMRWGIFDTRDTNAQKDEASSYANWFCSQTLSSSSEADSFGASIGFPFKGLPVKLGFDSSKQSWNEWKSSFCQDVRTTFSRGEVFEEHVKQASPAILDAFQACLKQKGAYAWLEYTADPAVFGYGVKFDTPVHKLDSIKVSFTAPQTVACSPDPRSVTVLSPNTFRATCRRHGDKLVKIVVNSADIEVAGAGTLVLAAIPKAPKLPGPVSHALQVDGQPVNINFTMKNAIQKSGCACGNGEITFPGDLRGKANEPINFNYDGSEVCHGQDFRNFDGQISWTGSQVTQMSSTKNNSTFPGIAGTVKVTFSEPGSYNVRAKFDLQCVDDGSAHCSQACTASGNTVVVVK